MSFVSFAQNYEDVMLARAFRGLRDGFYIDVGAQDPRFDSVTKAFYDMGWRGINLEPVEHWHARLLEDRPRDINLCLAAGDHGGLIEFHETDESGLSTASAEFARRHRKQGVVLRTRQVPVQTLDAIWAEHAPSDVHFLKVDVEGAEAEVLRGIDFERRRPWIVLVESTEPNSLVSTHESWESLITDHRYQLVYQDGLNRFYLAEEHADLAAAFAAPPNIFDNFIRREQFDLGIGLGARISELDRHVEEIDRLSQRRAEHLSTLEAALAEREQRLSAVAAERADSESRLVAEHELSLRRLQEIEHLSQEIDRRNQKIGELNREVADHTMQLARIDAELAVQRQALQEQRNRGIALAARLDQSERSAARLSALLSESESGLLASQAQLRATAQAHADSLGELARAQADFQRIIASRSWRITAPLRSFMTWLAELRERTAGALRVLAGWPWARRAAALALRPFPGLAARLKRGLYGEAQATADAPQSMRLLPISSDAEQILLRCPVQTRGQPGEVEP